MLTESLANRGLEDFKELHDQLKKGKLDSIPVFLSSFQNLYRGARIENLDELGDQEIPHLQGETLIGKSSWLAFSEEAKPLENEAELQIEAETDRRPTNRTTYALPPTSMSKSNYSTISPAKTILNTKLNWLDNLSVYVNFLVRSMKELEV